MYEAGFTSEPWVAGVRELGHAASGPLRDLRQAAKSGQSHGRRATRRECLLRLRARNRRAYCAGKSKLGRRGDRAREESEKFPPMKKTRCDPSS